MTNTQHDTASIERLNAAPERPGERQKLTAPKVIESLMEELELEDGERFDGMS